MQSIIFFYLMTEVNGENSLEMANLKASLAVGKHSAWQQKSSTYKWKSSRVVSENVKIFANFTGFFL